MTERALVSRTTMEIATALATGAAGAAVMWGAVEHEIGWGDSGPAAGYFPFRIGALIVLGSLANLVLAAMQRRPDGAVFLTREQGKRVALLRPAARSPSSSSRSGSAFTWARSCICSSTMVFQGGYRPLFALAVGLGSAVVMRLVFPMWFKVPLLTGPLEAMLGLY